MRPLPHFPWPNRLVLAALLATAAVLKGYQWITSGAMPPLVSLPEPFSFWEWPSLMAGELLLAVWLLSGKKPGLLIPVTAACFAGFAAVSLWRISRGIASCSCFGSLVVSPKLSFGIDCAALALVLPWAGWNRRVVLPLAGGVGAIAFALALFLAHGGAAPLGVAAFQIGHPWPPANAVMLEADLADGDWVVILYRSSCGRCHAAAKQYAEWAVEEKARRGNLRVALLDSDPRLEIALASTSPDSGIVEGILRTSMAVPDIPIVIQLQKGRVVAAREGWGAPISRF